MPQDHQSDLLDLIDAAYASAADRTKWGAFLSCVTTRLGGLSTIYRWSRSSPSDNRPLIDNFDEFGRSYRAHYSDRNVWVTNAIGMSQSIIPSEQIVPTAALERTEFYNDWLRPQRLKHGISCQLTDRHGLAYSLGIIRSPSLGEFGREEQRLLSAVMPHVQRALELGYELERLDLHALGALEAFTSLGIGALTVNASGRIIFANAKADRMLASVPGLSASAGRLVASPAAIDVRLRRAIYAAAGGGQRRKGRTGTVLGIPAPDAPPITVSVTPLQESDQPGAEHEPLALLIISDSSSPGKSAGNLTAVYGLTGAEAKLAAALLDGETLNDYALRIGITLPTVKTQLAAVFAKVGVNRQADLIRVLATNASLRYRPTDAHN